MFNVLEIRNMKSKIKTENVFVEITRGIQKGSIGIVDKMSGSVDYMVYFTIRFEFDDKPPEKIKLNQRHVRWLKSYKGTTIMKNPNHRMKDMVGREMEVGDIIVFNKEVSTGYRFSRNLLVVGTIEKFNISGKPLIKQLMINNTVSTDKSRISLSETAFALIIKNDDSFFKKMMFLKLQSV